MTPENDETRKELRNKVRWYCEEHHELLEIFSLCEFLFRKLQTAGQTLAGEEDTKKQVFDHFGGLISRTILIKYSKC